MPGLLSALEGFCVIGIVIGTGYVAARMRIGGPTAQMVLNRFSFFVSSPCLMFAILAKERIFEIFHSSIVVAFFSAVLVGLVFLILNRLFFHLKAADATIGALNSLYLNSTTSVCRSPRTFWAIPLWSRRFWSCNRRCSHRSA